MEGRRNNYWVFPKSKLSRGFAFSRREGGVPSRSFPPKQSLWYGTVSFQDMGKELGLLVRAHW